MQCVAFGRRSGKLILLFGVLKLKSNFKLKSKFFYRVTFNTKFNHRRVRSFSQLRFITNFLCDGNINFPKRMSNETFEINLF